MYTFFVKRPAYTHIHRTQVFRSWKPGSANTLIGQKIGRFQFTQEISSNDTDSLYQGLDLDNNSLVAIKLFSPEISQIDSFVTQFKSDLRQAKSITADGLVPIHDAGMTTKNQLYVVTDYVNGISLGNWVYPDGQRTEWSQKMAAAIEQQQEIAGQRDAVSTVMSLRFAEQIGQQIALFEKQNLAHKNLSLGKFIIQSNDQLIVLGYGIPSTLASPKKNGRIYPLAYESPEQTGRATTTIQSNIYSLGVILYEMLAGSRPLVKNKQQRVDRVYNSDWLVNLSEVKDGLSAETYALVATCLNNQPWNRFASVAEMQAAITTALQIETAVAEPLLNKETALATPIVMTTDTAVPVTTPIQPQIKPVTKKRPAKKQKPLAETLKAAAILPPQPTIQTDASEEEKKRRALFPIILPVVVMLLCLMAGGFFFMRQGQNELNAAPIAAVVKDGGAPVQMVAATTAPPSLTIIAPEKNQDYLLSDQITFQVRWPQPLADGAELRLHLQKNTWGNGQVLGLLLPGSEESDLYEFTIPATDISQSLGAYWWQVMLDADGSGVQLGIPLSELRPFNLVTLTATETSPAPFSTVTATPTPTPVPTPETIACIPNPDWVVHTIKQNDTFSGLAQQTRTTVEQILIANCLDEVIPLTINNPILLPAAIAQPTSTPTATYSPTATTTPTPFIATSVPPTSVPPTKTPVPPTATIPPLSTTIATPAPTRASTRVATATVPPLPTATKTPTPIPPTNTPIPTAIPTAVPTAVPTDVPTAIPTAVPTAVPTDVPTDVPPAIP